MDDPGDKKPEDRSRQENDDKAKKPEIQNTVMDVGPERRDGRQASTEG